MTNKEGRKMMVEMKKGAKPEKVAGKITGTDGKENKKHIVMAMRAMKAK
jgi:hypothetical protein